MTSLSLTLTGARVLTEQGFRQQDLSFSNGVLVEDVQPRRIDLSGCLVLPGIVDLHGDGFERHLAPRRGAATDLGLGLAALDRELAAAGITTATLAQFFSWEGGMRGPVFAARLVDALAASPTLTVDMRLQLRLEIGLVEAFEEFEALVDRGKVGCVIFNDHLPHAALAAGRRPPRLTGQALKAGRNPEAHLSLLSDLHRAVIEGRDAVAALAGRLAARGVRLGSHDDPDPATRDRFRTMGARIAEFPLSVDAAQAAHMAGDTVVLGAPNVVRGSSHDGNLSARQVIGAGHVGVLVSDYHYPSLVQAALLLSDEGLLPLEKAWALISTNPARALGLTDRGSLSIGHRADFVVMDTTRHAIGATFVAGQPALLTGALAARFIGEATSPCAPESRSVRQDWHPEAQRGGI